MRRVQGEPRVVPSGAKPLTPTVTVPADPRNTGKTEFPLDQWGTELSPQGFGQLSLRYLFGYNVTNPHLRLQPASNYLISRVASEAGQGSVPQQLERMSRFVQKHFDSRGVGELYGKEAGDDRENLGQRDILNSFRARAGLCADQASVIWTAAQRLGLDVTLHGAMLEMPDGSSGHHAYLRTTTADGTRYIVNPNWKREQPVLTEAQYAARGYRLVGEIQVQPDVAPIW